MNKGCALARAGHPLGFLDKLFVQIDRRTHPHLVMHEWYIT